MHFDEDGIKYYDCNYCLDMKFLHPRKEDGNPDYSRNIPCRYCNTANPTPAPSTQSGLFGEKQSNG